MIRFPVALIFIALSGCNNMQDEKSRFIEREIERKIVMPSGARDTVYYDRYYYDDGVTIFATFVASEGIGALHIVNAAEMPGIEDGGCTVVRAKFNKKTKEIEGVRCNGVS